ncbi:methyltransferase domain-containing protein [Microvirga sp. VF16]|uniref:methyltransferase domain-containing protein n=1 Tax=Microvirga sp. VF16 TaxID=2807101 RepID=UPI00193E2979|nr:methyltransferase domain-containing protein [Microvirga sp. VF16]QRM28282.1 methyltransferase domain-containing protein [Microvirga sp. VF16]
MAEKLAGEILKVCGWGSALDVGCGMGDLVAALSAQGIAASGVDVSEIAVAVADRKCPGRIRQESMFALSNPNCSVDIVTAIHSLESIAQEDVTVALHELFRVAKRSVYIRVRTEVDSAQSSGAPRRDRAWWETQLLQVGFRKHPRYYVAIPYESLENEPDDITIVMERPPAAVLERYPLSALAAERDLHMDMAREQGRRSDAHMIRYFEAARFIRPGDRVLDAACGLGYGTHILAHNSLASEVTGIDASDYAVEYASLAYGAPNRGITFRKGFLPDALNQLPEGSVDFIASFETLEHLEHADPFLQACARVLAPGGRLMVSVPHDWSDETGVDPNPHHFRLYDWHALIREVGAEFLLERAFVQSASRKKIDGAWSVTPREWRSLPVDDAPRQTSEWCLLLAMRDPLAAAGQRYEERMFPPAAVEAKPALLDFSGQYKNPWLIRSMVSIGPRMSDPVELEKIADRVLESTVGGSDEAAALCVIAYRMLENGRPKAEFAHLIKRFMPYTSLEHPETSSPIAIRWAVSLLYVQGILEMGAGDHQAAKQSLERCAALPFWIYSPLLGTKTIDAAFRLGVLSQVEGDRESAKRWWRCALDMAQRAVQSDWNEQFGSLDAPPDFAFREMTQLLDLATRCATALSVLDQISDNPAAVERTLYNKAKQVYDLREAATIERTRLETGAAMEREHYLAVIGRLQAEAEHMNVHVQSLQTEAEHMNAHVQSLQTDITRLETDLRAARAVGKRVPELEAKLAKERRQTAPYRGQVPTYRWLLGHLRRKVLRKGIPILPLIPDAKKQPRKARPNATPDRREPSKDSPKRVPVLSSGQTQTVAQTIIDVAKFEPDIAGAACFNDLDQLLVNRSIPRGSHVTAWKQLFESLDRPYDYLIFVPWLTRGGADLAAVNAVRAAIQLRGTERTLLVVTDYDRVEARDWLPETANIRIFSDLLPDLSASDRVRLVQMLIMALKPRAVLNVNSVACWEAIKKTGSPLSTMTDIYASLFCRDYTSDGRAAGYADTHFRACLPFTRKIYFDNETFAQQMIEEYGVPPSLQSRIEVLRQPTSNSAQPRGFVRQEGVGRLPVFWAGRFARQKNVDLLIEIVSSAPDFHFDVYGDGDESYKQKLNSVGLNTGNLTMKGAFPSFEALPTQQYGAFLYTSLWDGIPTVLINAASLGVPIVASNVGGIAELVDDDTGWLINDYKDPSAYIRALVEIRANPEEAARRVQCMLERVKRLHSWDTYTTTLSETPSFLAS